MAEIPLNVHGMLLLDKWLSTGNKTV
jgi:hypothetical protein